MGLCTVPQAAESKKAYTTFIQIQSKYSQSNFYKTQRLSKFNQSNLNLNFFKTNHAWRRPNRIPLTLNMVR